MTETRHVLAGAGAEKFADVAGVERVENTFFDTDGRRRLQRMLRERARTGRLCRRIAASIRHGGLRGAGSRRAARGGDQHGRHDGREVGPRWGYADLGAGNYADDYAAISCTGTGEEFIRRRRALGDSADAAGGQTLADAAGMVVHAVLQRGDGGLIAVDREGNVATPFNTTGMYRASANWRGDREVAIFHDE